MHISSNKSMILLKNYSSTTKMEMSNHDSEMEFPQYFRCPISMEIMKDPVIISTGVTYERRSIEKWFFTYKKAVCPATMQSVENFDITPNNTLKRLILAWRNGQSPSSSSSSSPSSSPLSSLKRDEMELILKTLNSNPFKVSSLRKIKEIVENGDEMKLDFVLLGGLEVVFRLIVQILVDSSDFMVFRACEEALGLLQHLPISQESDGKVINLFLKPEFMKAMVIVLQRGSKEARVYAMSMLRKLANLDFNWNVALNDQGVGMFKSILELASDEISTKASSCALQVLIKILDSSQESRLKAIEAGAMCTLIELLPDSNRSKTEKILLIIKLLCECANGRVAFIEHGLGICAISSKVFSISEIASKICIQIFLLICTLHDPTNKILEDMLIYGVIKKLAILMHMSGPSSTKNKMVNMFKKHSYSWSRYPCFPSELKEYI